MTEGEETRTRDFAIKANHTLIEQPMSLDSKEAIAANSNAKRRGSRKSRSLRSTHLAMMSRPLVTSMIAGDDEMLDKSSSSESSLLGKILFYNVDCHYYTMAGLGYFLFKIDMQVETV